MEAALDLYFNLGKGTIEKGLLPVPGTPAYRDAWQKTIEAAEEANDPGRFTAFIGFEWTSGTGGNNLHRNVIFRDDAARASQVEPFTAQKPFGSDNPRDLWKYMAAYEAKTGGNVLAIAHNGNGSNGRMFPIIESFTGKRIDREYAENRRRWEPLYEVTQMKGTSEAHPFLSPNDEFANFEIWDKGNLDVSAAKKPEMLEFEYARSAFKNGLKLEGGARPQSLQVRSGRIHGLAHGARGGRRGQLLRQDVRLRAEPDADRASLPQEPGYRHHDHGLGSDRVGLRGRLGDREYARGDLGCHGTP